MGGTADPHAAGFAEAHAKIVLNVLKLAPDLDYPRFLKRKLVGWFQATPKSDRHAPSQEERGEEVDEEGEAGRGVRAHWALCLIWTNKPLQPDFDGTEDRPTDVGDEQGLNSI